MFRKSIKAHPRMAIGIMFLHFGRTTFLKQLYVHVHCIDGSNCIQKGYRILWNIIKDSCLYMYMFVQAYTILVWGEVSALDFGLSGPDSSPGQGHYVVLWARHLTLTVPLSCLWSALIRQCKAKTKHLKCPFVYRVVLWPMPFLDSLFFRVLCY